jgi:hypothetical protein
MKQIDNGKVLSILEEVLSSVTVRLGNSEQESGSTSAELFNLQKNRIFGN